MAQRLRTYASFIKLEHTIFSLPLIFAGTWLALRRWPGPALAAGILLAAIGARVMAMGLNRLIDMEIDERNPRTQRRELPRGAMRRWEGWVIVMLAGLLYVASASAIAPICAWLSPIPVCLFVIYPYLKRLTALSHLGLGLAWSMAPLGGWLAAVAQAGEVASGRWAWYELGFEFVGDVVWLWLFSLLWVAGFDIIYATMDEAVDRREGLHSLPARWGKRPALRVAALLHALAFLALCALWRTQLTSPLALVWLAGIGALFIWQHAAAERRPEFAFFQLNGLLGFLVLGFVATSM